MANNMNQKPPNEGPAQPKTPPQPKSLSQTKKWFGCVRDGNFWCDCSPRDRAKCNRVSKPGGNKGRLFWSCAKAKDDRTQCPFFVWMEDEAEAKEWLAKYGPQEAPETPKSDETVVASDTPSTLSTKEKRKPVSRETLDESETEAENGGLSGRRVDDGYVFVDVSPSRKGPKRVRFETAGGKSFVEKLREARLPPTPDTLEKGKGKERALESAPNGFPTPAARGEKADLMTKVLNLLRKDKAELNESTLEKIRLEINLELNSNAAKVSIYEESISRLSKKLDGLETAAKKWPGVDDPIELSD